LITGGHAAAFVAGIPASHRRYVWLGSATEGDDSFPLTCDQPILGERSADLGERSADSGDQLIFKMTLPS
jgi:hypothetical protein